MRSTYSAFRAIGLGLIVLGAIVIGLRVAQAPHDLVVYSTVTPTLFFDKELRVRIGNGPDHLVGAFEKAVEDWNAAVREFNYWKTVECKITVLLGGCRKCVNDSMLPEIRVAEGSDYNVFVDFSDDIPAEGAIAYSAFLEGSVLARIVVWRGVPEHRAYQVAIHEVSRLYGLHTTTLRRTLFGAIPASIDTNLLHSSMEEFMNGDADPLTPTTIELYASYQALNRHYQYRYDGAGLPIAYRAWGELDFTIPSLISPILIVVGVYLLSRGWRHAG